MRYVLRCRIEIRRNLKDFFYLFLAGSEIADQDSLDGQLPSNRHSAAAGHLDTPLPLPPKNGRPASPPSGDGNHEPQSFTKGPASKHKKHRRLNREQVRKLNSIL